MYRRNALIAVMAALLCAGVRADRDDLVFDLTRSDISGASLKGGMVQLQLSPCRAVEFHRLTQRHIGRPLSVRFEGVPVLQRVHIQAAIQSGLIVFNSTDERVLSKLAGVAPPQQETDRVAVNCAARPASAR
jgi:hypothetical protein